MVGVAIVALFALMTLGACFGTSTVISFMTNGGSAVDSVTVENGAESVVLPSTQKTGYTFTGWYADRACTIPVSSELIGDEIPTSSVTYYAGWEIMTMRATFYVEDTVVGFVTNDYNTLVKKEDFPSLEDYEGYVFEEESFFLTYNRSIYAVKKGTEVKEHTVTYYVPTENGFEEYATYQGPEGERIGVPASPSSTETAYFSDWCYDEEGEVKCEVLPTAIPSSDVKLYALFVEVESDVRYLYFEEITPTTLCITGLTSIGNYQPTVVVPSEIDGKKVVKIGGTEETGFRSRFVKSVVLPETVTEVGDYAFADCVLLEEVVFVGNATTKIGKYAFSGCVSLKKIDVPSNVTVIDDYAFAKAENGEDMTLAAVNFKEDSKISRIGDYAFDGCVLLRDVTLGKVMSDFNHLAFAGSGAEDVSFYEGGRLKGVEGGVYSADGKILYFYPENANENYIMPSGMEEIAAGAFTNNKNLLTIAAVPTLVSIGDDAFSGCEKLTEADFSQTGLTLVGNNAFYECKALQSAILPSALTSLGERAFYGCVSLERATMTDVKAEEIKDGTFYGCERLRSFSVPLSVRKIGNEAFYGCERMTAFTMSPRGALTEVGDYALYDCVNVGSVLFTSSVKTIGAYAFGSKTKRMALEFNADNSLSGIERFGEGAFMNTNVSQITISGNIATNEDFGKFVFKNCTSLQQVTFSASGYTTVPEGLFHGCSLLRTITLSSNVLEIEKNAFYNCASLESVQFGNVRKIGESAFEGCTNLVNGGGNNRVLPTYLTEIGKRAFYGCARLSTVNIPSGLTALAAETFGRCVNLTSVSYDAGTTLGTIGENAFIGCTSLTRAVLPSTLLLKDEADTVGLVKNPFVGCLSLSEFVFNETPESDLFARDGIVYRRLYLPNGTDYSGEASVYAFPTAKSTAAYDVPTFVTTAENERLALTEIDRYAFFGSTIPDLTFSRNAQVAGREDMAMLKIGDYAFAESSVSRVNVSLRVYEIGKYAFASGALKTVTIDGTFFRTGYTVVYNIINRSQVVEDNLLTIGDYAFSDIETETFTLPARVKEIGEGAFAYDYTLTEITLIGEENGNKLTNLVIGDRAFESDALITKLTLPKNVTDIGAYAFYRCNNLEDVTFVTGDEPLDIGEYAFGEAHYLYSVTLPSNLRSMGTGVFAQNTRLKYVYFAETQTAGTVGLEIPAYAFVGATVMTDVTVPAYVTAIGERAFRNTSVRSVLFEGTEADDGLVIGKEAFAELTTLKVIDLPNNLTEIGEGAFSFSELRSVSLSDTGKDVRIGKEAFRATLLNSFEGNDRIKEIDEGAFADVESLFEFVSGNGVTEIPARMFENCNTLANVILGTEVVAVGDRAFYGTAVTEFDGVKFETIGKNAFTDSALIQIRIEAEEDVQIHESAFESASDLQSFILTTPKSLSVNKYAFRSCGALKTLSMTAEVAVIDPGFAVDADQVGSGLFELNETGENDSYEVRDGVVYTKDGKSIVYYAPSKPGSTYELTEEVERIEDYAFYNASALTGLIVRGDDVKKEENTFSASNRQLVIYVNEDKTTYYANEWGMQNIVSGKTVLDGMILEIQSSGGYTLKEYLGTAERIELGGVKEENGVRYAVTEIGENAFRNNTYLKELVIGSGVKTVGGNAFRGCVSLERVTVGENVTSVKSYAFYGCTSLEEVVFSADGSLLSIGNYAFAYDETLHEVIIPDSVETLGIFAFSDCSGLERLVVGKRVEEVGNNAFENCASLTSVVFPESVKKLGSYVFNGCDDLAYLEFDGENVCSIEMNTFGGIGSDVFFFVKDAIVEKAYKTDVYWRTYVSKILSSEYKVSDAGYENYVIKKDGSAYTLVAYLGTEKDVTLLSDIALNGERIALTKIGEYAVGKFAERVTIGEGFETIGDRAFYYADNLQKIVFPNSLKTIGAYAFASVSSLREAEFKENCNVTSVGAYAFYRCYALNEIVLPESVTTIGDYAFADIGLNTFAFAERENKAPSLAIGSYAFSGNGILKSIVFRAKIGSVGDGAFAWCVSLESLYFDYEPKRGEGNIAPTLGEATHIFEDCDKLNIVLPNVSVRDDFRNRWNEKYKADTNKFVAKEHVVGEFVYAIISQTARAVTVINYLGTSDVVEFVAEPQIALEKYTLTRIGRESSTAEIKGYVIGDNVREVYIPGTVTTIGADAFRNSLSLETVHIPSASQSKLEKIESYAFAGCRNLENITIPTTVKLIDAYAFYDCDALDTGFVFEESSVPPTTPTLTLGAYAFASCDVLSAFYIPNHVAGIGSQRSSTNNVYGYTFSDCVNLRTVTFSETAKVTYIERYAFANTAIKEITLPVSLEEIAGYVFSNCENLRTVYLTRTVGGGIARTTTAADSVFDGVPTAHVKVYVPSSDFDVYASSTGWREKTVIKNSVSNDGRFAYEAGYSASDLYIVITDYRGDEEELVIPREIAVAEGIGTVTTLGPYFANSTVRKITFPSGSGVTAAQEYAFAGCIALEEVHLPNTLTSLGTRAFEGCVNLTDITLSENLSDIKEFTFYNCSALREITLPASITNGIGPSAFYRCTNLARVKVEFAVTENNVGATLGNSAFGDTGKGYGGLTIIVPDMLYGIFRSGWLSVRDNIYAESSVIGDYIVQSNDRGTELMLMQYLGTGAEVDLTELTLKGLPITSIASGAIGNDYTTFVVGKDFVFPQTYADRIKVKEE